LISFFVSISYLITPFAWVVSIFKLLLKASFQ